MRISCASIILSLSMTLLLNTVTLTHAILIRALLLSTVVHKYAEKKVLFYSHYSTLNAIICAEISNEQLQFTPVFLPPQQILHFFQFSAVLLHISNVTFFLTCLSFSFWYAPTFAMDLFQFVLYAFSFYSLTTYYGHYQKTTGGVTLNHA